MMQPIDMTILREITRNVRKDNVRDPTYLYQRGMPKKKIGDALLCFIKRKRQWNEPVSRIMKDSLEHVMRDGSQLE